MILLEMNIEYRRDQEHNISVCQNQAEIETVFNCKGIYLLFLF